MKTREQAGVEHRYPSRRSVVYSDRGMVCTSQTLAAQAGLEMLKKGGNAVDAALATAIALTVLEPVSNGLGSDAFAIVWSAEEQKLFGLNGSGWAPRLLTLGRHAPGRLPEHAGSRLGFRYCTGSPLCLGRITPPVRTAAVSTPV
jgi:gamma-glutamyltranspeptidase